MWVQLTYPFPAFVQKDWEWILQSVIAVFSLGVNGAKIVAEVSGKVGGSNHNNRALFSDITEEN